MTWENPENKQIKSILESAKTIAVVGLSNDPNKVSYQVSKVMQSIGYRIIPVNPTVDEVLGEQSYASLTDITIDFDIINVFRRPEYLPSIAREAAETNCRVFWTQQGIKNQVAYDYLKDHDFTVIMDKCIKVAYAGLVQ